MFQTSRRRLALWYTGVTAILLLLFATGVYFYVRSTLIERMDDTLKHVTEVVERSLIIQPDNVSELHYHVNIEASFRDNADGVEDDHIDLEWFNDNGKLVWSTFSEPLAIPLHVSRKGKTIHLHEDQWLRQITKSIELRHQVLGYLRVSHPWFEVTKPTQQLIWDLSIGTSAILVCTASIGWLLSGLAMKPVRDSYQSLKQFTADASHELRNPIAMIQTNVQMALAYAEDEPQLQQRQLRVIERLTQRVGNLVNDLLFLARSDSGIVQTNCQNIPLDALLIGVIEEQRAVAQQHKIYLSLQISEPLEQYKQGFTQDNYFTTKGDWDQLARLFTNLISNALEHSNFYSSINQDKLDCSNNSQVAAVEVKLQLTGRLSHPQLEVKVRDTGKGIPTEALPHIFDRFYTVNQARSHKQTVASSTGAGLGLAIAHAIVDNHQGQITVESVVSQGTTFCVILPASKPSLGESAK